MLIEVNQSDRMALIAIGDIHGCARTLETLIETLMPGPTDHLVFLGDYVDRGPDSCGVINLLVELEQSYRCTFLRGNHEAYMLQWCETGSCEDWLLYGGHSTLQSYRRTKGAVRVPEHHVGFLSRTQFFLDTPRYLFVHGGLEPSLTVEQNLKSSNPEVFMCCRAHLRVRRVVWEKCVVFGHTPVPEPILTEHMIGLDTGCVFAGRQGMGRLTAIRLPERYIVSVPNCET
ncbi:MAG: metallophosphoesterase family protein [Bacteroidota bacterium]|nr:metallophosphoesterase family protein [Bacteroidota bacterium]